MARIAVGAPTGGALIWSRFDGHRDRLHLGGREVFHEASPRSFWFKTGMLALLPFVVPMLCEWRWGVTLGKQVAGVRVVTERGTRISFSQALMRYIPMIGQFFWIDVAFVFFNEQRQRAFEKLSHTRVIVSR